MIIETALAYMLTVHSEIDPELAAAVAFTESSLRCTVGENHVGAIGLMQVKPIAAKAVGMPSADLHDCATNIRVGTRYLKRLIDRYGVYRGLRAYNCGPTGARRRPQCGKAYAEKVLRALKNIQAEAETNW